ncbi:MAG: hypothetical protein ACOC8I_04505 [Desulfosalsimonas sp.]
MGCVLHVLRSGKDIYRGQKYNRLMDLPQTPPKCLYLSAPEVLTTEAWQSMVAGA